MRQMWTEVIIALRRRVAVVIYYLRDCAGTQFGMGAFSLQPRPAIIWNSLPPNICTIDTMPLTLQM